MLTKALEFSIRLQALPRDSMKTPVPLSLREVAKAGDGVIDTGSKFQFLPLKKNWVNFILPYIAIPLSLQHIIDIKLCYWDILHSLFHSKSPKSHKYFIAHHSWNKTHFPVLQLTGCVTLGQCLPVSEPQLPWLWNRHHLPPSRGLWAAAGGGDGAPRAQ